MNLLQETRHAIESSGHTPADVVFIGSTGDPAYECSWDEFEQLADFDYDEGYGGQHIATDLRIVFTDGSDMHRGEYDGSEWWEFSKPFVRPETTERITTLGGGRYLWVTLHDINKQSA